VLRAKKKRIKHLVLILFSTASLAVLIITAYTIVLINSFSSVFLGNIEERLLATVRSAERISTPEELFQFRAPEDMLNPLYSEIRTRLIKFGEEHNIIFIYYYYLREDGTVQPIVDNDFTEDAYTLYSDPIPMEKALEQSIKRRTAVTTALGAYSVEYERILSAFAPIIDASGEVAGIVGVDISDEQLLFFRNRLRLLSAMLFSAMAFTIVCGLISFFTYRKNEQNLSSRLDQQKLMSSLSASFISDKKTDVLINDTLQLTGKFLGIDRMVVSLTGKNFSIYKPAYFWCRGGGIPVDPELAGLNELLKNTFSQVNPGIDTITLFCNDVESNNKYHFMRLAGVRAFMWAPLYVDGKLWAILGVECLSGPRLWSDSDRQLVSTVASVIAGAAARDLHEKERNAARETAEKASRAKSDFLANMSHEMRTPMNAVIGMTSIAKTSRDIEKKDYCLKKIEEASSHLLGVINDILDMSKIEANKFDLSAEDFNFEKMLQKVINVSSFKMDEKKQICSVHIDRKIPPILFGDDQRLAQIIANLVSNAVKFTPEGGFIRLETECVEEAGDLCTIKISVSDTGIGVTEEQKKRLFSSFEQADSSTSRKFGGTGLGLAISKRIVEMMNGRIWVDSRPGQGSTFAFTAVFRKGTIQEKQSLLNPGIDWHNVRLLVVDDDKTVLELFNELAGWFGLNCTTVNGSSEALTMIGKDSPYDIYFLDWKMPGMDGVELAEQIKTRTEQKSAIVLMTSADWSFIEEKARQAGVEKIVAKPLFPSVIAECINQCTGREETTMKDEGTIGTDDFSGYRIILAEDVEINREILLSLLEPTGLAVDCACNGIEAVELFTSSPDKYAMIFMDVQMPEMDGYEATRRIRAFEAKHKDAAGSDRSTKNDPEFEGQTLQTPESLKGIPVIAMTANVFKEDVDHCIDAGMNGHVGKPLDMEAVLAQLRKHLFAK